MSSENVELVRRAVAAAYQRPKPDFATVNALFHPDHEQISYASRVEGQTGLRGAAAFRDWLESTDEVFQSWEASLEDVREIDGDRVLVAGVFRGLGKLSGAPVAQPFGLVVAVRDGKIVRSETYASAEEALAAAGAPE